MLHAAPGMVHESSTTPQEAPSSSMSCADEQEHHTGPSIQPPRNVPGGITRVPIGILVFHRRLTGRGSRPQLPAPALPDVSEGDRVMDPSQAATSYTCNPDPASVHLRSDGLDDEAAKTVNGTEASQLQQLEMTGLCDGHINSELLVPAMNMRMQVQQRHASTALVAEESADGSVNMYQPQQKRPKIMVSQTEHTPISAPALLKEKTLNQIEMQLAGGERSKIFRNEETPTQKLKIRRKKHRPKVIRDNRLAKVQKSADSTPNGKSPNQKVKRKYVRKKKILDSSGSFCDQSISKEPGTDSRKRTESVRRALCFEPEEQGVQVGHSSTANSQHSYEKLIHAQSSFCSRTESEVRVGHGLQVDMENSPGGLAFGMSRKLNDLLDEYIHLPEVAPNSIEDSNTICGSFSTEVGRGHDSVGQTYEPHVTNKSGFCIEERKGKIITEGNKRGLESNDSNANDFLCSDHRCLTGESTRSPVSEVNHTDPNDGESSLADTPDSVILRTAAEIVAFCQVGGVKKKRSARVRRNFSISTMGFQESTSQACMDALYESSYIKFLTKKRSQKVRPHCPDSVQPNMELKNRLATGSIFYGGPNGSKTSENTTEKSLPRTVDDIDLEGVASKLEYLGLNAEQVHVSEKHLPVTTPAVISFGRADDLSNALVPYGGDTVIVPCERPLQLVKRKRSRAKVDMDFETTRVWNLLMGKSAEPADGTDVEKERWWQQEREVFQGRANSFIARMRLVQGDRHFSPWKGSVVDSVVGVFLTQNVADHLSSSAFMALASSFPSRPGNGNYRGNTTTQATEPTATNAPEEESMFGLFSNDARTDLGISCEELPMTYEKIHMEAKHNSCAYDYFDHKSANAGVCNHQGTGIAHMPDFSSVEFTSYTEMLQQIQLQKEISSSQSVTLENLHSRISLNYGTSRNFIVGESSAAYEYMESNIGHGNSLTGSDNTNSEIECHRLEKAPTNDYVIGKPGIPCSYGMPFISNFDSQKLDLRTKPNVSWTSPNSSSDSASPSLRYGTIENRNTFSIPFDSHVSEMSSNKTVGSTPNYIRSSTELSVKLHHDKRTSLEASSLPENESIFVTGGMREETVRKEDGCVLKSSFTSYNVAVDTEAQASRPNKTRTPSKRKMENFDWDKLRRQTCTEGHTKERSSERKDSVDWDAVRCADVQKISHAIRERGMNNVLAERIQSFLNRLVRDHGSIDLEWLRDIPSDLAKDYLLSIRGLGLKSVECVRLLTLHHRAFPVDTNVGRICVRLGWVPIQPLPESLQLHLLELYPILETIQKYLWPRLCKLDQQTLYELHYHMITFGKVFCTKSKPNCNACPMRSECKHFASAFASARLALPAPQEKSLVKSGNQFMFQNSSTDTMSSTYMPLLEGTNHARDFLPNNSQPIIEEPASPREEEYPETVENDIEDFDEDGEIPTIKLNMEAFAQNLETCIKESNKEFQSDDIAKALIAISTESASIPVPKLKNMHRLRTEHYVYEIPDAHPLILQLGLEQREPDDPSPYLLAIWTPGDIKEISKTPKPCCDSQMEGGLCNNEMCDNCIADRVNQSRYVRGTILVPCRTAMRGSFPLNGTYFQVNEVFADHRSSHNPIFVARDQLWNLHRRMVFFGTSVPTIFKGLTTEEIQHCFWRGFVCVRGFDMETRAPRPLCPHLHVVARPKTKKSAATDETL